MGTRTLPSLFTKFWDADINTCQTYRLMSMSSFLSSLKSSLREGTTLPLPLLGLS